MAGADSSEERVRRGWPQNSGPPSVARMLQGASWSCSHLGSHQARGGVPSLRGSRPSEAPRSQGPLQPRYLWQLSEGLPLLPSLAPTRGSLGHWGGCALHSGPRAPQTATLALLRLKPSHVGLLASDSLQAAPSRPRPTSFSQHFLTRVGLPAQLRAGPNALGSQGLCSGSSPTRQVRPHITRIFRGGGRTHGMSVQATLGDPASLWVPRSKPRAQSLIPVPTAVPGGLVSSILVSSGPSANSGQIPGCGELQARRPARPHPRAELFPSPGLRPEAPLSAACWLGPACSSLTPSLLHPAGLYVACSPLPDRPPPPACTLIVGQPLRFGCLWSNTIWEGLLDFPPTR